MLLTWSTDVWIWLQTARDPARRLQQSAAAAYEPSNHVGGMMVYWANKATSILFSQAEMCTKLRLNCATTTGDPHPEFDPFQHPQNEHKTLIMKLLKMKNFRFSFWSKHFPP